MSAIIMPPPMDPNQLNSGMFNPPKGSAKKDGASSSASGDTSETADSPQGAAGDASNALDASDITHKRDKEHSGGQGGDSGENDDYRGGEFTSANEGAGTTQGSGMISIHSRGTTTTNQAADAQAVSMSSIDTLIDRERQKTSNSYANETHLTNAQLIAQAAKMTQQIQKEVATCVHDSAVEARKLLANAGYPDAKGLSDTEALLKLQEGASSGKVIHGTKGHKITLTDGEKKAFQKLSDKVAGEVAGLRARIQGVQTMTLEKGAGVFNNANLPGPTDVSDIGLALSELQEKSSSSQLQGQTDVMRGAQRNMETQGKQQMSQSLKLQEAAALEKKAAAHGFFKGLIIKFVLAVVGVALALAAPVTGGASLALAVAVVAVSVATLAESATQLGVYISSGGNAEKASKFSVAHGIGLALHACGVKQDLADKIGTYTVLAIQVAVAIGGLASLATSVVRSAMNMTVEETGSLMERVFAKIGGGLSEHSGSIQKGVNATGSAANIIGTGVEIDSNLAEARAQKASYEADIAAQKAAKNLVITEFGLDQAEKAFKSFLDKLDKSQQGIAGIIGYNLKSLTALSRL